MLAGCYLQVSTKGCPFAACGTGEAEQRAKVTEELQRRTQRIRTCQVGKRTPYPEPRLLHELTDELLLASSVVSHMSAPALPGIAIFRLLALAVADAHWLTTRACVRCLLALRALPPRICGLAPASAPLKICRALFILGAGRAPLLLASSAPPFERRNRDFLRWGGGEG